MEEKWEAIELICVAIIVGIIICVGICMAAWSNKNANEMKLEAFKYSIEHQTTNQTVRIK